MREGTRAVVCVKREESKWEGETRRQKGGRPVVVDRSRRDSVVSSEAVKLVPSARARRVCRADTIPTYKRVRGCDRRRQNGARPRPTTRLPRDAQLRLHPPRARVKRWRDASPCCATRPSVRVSKAALSSFNLVLFKNIDTYVCI